MLNTLSYFKLKDFALYHAISINKAKNICKELEKEGILTKVGSEKFQDTYGSRYKYLPIYKFSKGME